MLVSELRMAYIKVHVVPGKELSVEGEDEVVLTILEKYAPGSRSNLEIKEEVEEVVDTTEETERTTLATVVYQSTPRTEAEWLVIYAYFMASQTFTRQDLIVAYRNTQRYTHNRSKNLSFNLKVAVKHDWLKVFDDGRLALTAGGRAYAEEILKRKASA